MSKAAAAPAENTTDPATAETTTTTPPAETKPAEPAAESKPEPKPKSEKSYTKAEIDAAAKKAVEDAQKKWESEKDLSELERIKKENEDLKASQRLRDAKDTVLEALNKANARTPDLLWKTLAGDLEFDDKGKIKNLETLVGSLQTDYPDQFGEKKPGETIDGGAGQGGNAGTALTKEKLAGMTPAEIQKLDWEEVKKVMASK